MPEMCDIGEMRRFEAAHIFAAPSNNVPRSCIHVVAVSVPTDTSDVD